MSLINEALKKAQKQRTGESPSLSSMPSIGGEKASQIARRGAPTGFNTLLLRLGLGLGALVILVLAGIVLLRDKGREAPPATVAAGSVATPQPTSPPPPVTATPSDPAPAVTAAPATPATGNVTVPNTAPAPTVVATPASPSANTFVVPNVTPAAVTPVKNGQPAAVQPPAAPIVVQTPVAPVVEPPKPEPARPAAPAKLEPRAINFIEGLRVAGIRASTTDSKVLMNDRVYRLGDIVEHEMSLKLVGITPHSLTFEDDRGARYTRNF